MKKSGLKLGVVSLIVLVATTLTSARTPTVYSAIKGTWLNASSGVLVKIVIGTDTTGRLFIHPYGACSPTPCDWGIAYPAVFSGAVGSSTVKALTATYGSSAPISRVLTASLVSVNGITQLRVSLFSHFAERGDPRSTTR
jgi:hypothetical protein